MAEQTQSPRPDAQGVHWDSIDDVPRYMSLERFPWSLVEFAQEWGGVRGAQIAQLFADFTRTDAQYRIPYMLSKDYDVPLEERKRPILTVIADSRAQHDYDSNHASYPQEVSLLLREPTGDPSQPPVCMTARSIRDPRRSLADQITPVWDPFDVYVYVDGDQLRMVKWHQESQHKHSRDWVSAVAQRVLELQAG